MKKYRCLGTSSCFAHREIDAAEVRHLDNKKPTGPQQTRAFPKCRCRIVEVLEHRPCRDGVITLVREAAVFRKSLLMDRESMGISRIAERFDPGHVPVELGHDGQEVTACGTDVQQPAGVAA